jgi:hypothetical protein
VPGADPTQVAPTDAADVTAANDEDRVWRPDLSNELLSTAFKPGSDNAGWSNAVYVVNPYTNTAGALDAFTGGTAANPYTNNTFTLVSDVTGGDDAAASGSTPTSLPTDHVVDVSQTAGWPKVGETTFDGTVFMHVQGTLGGVAYDGYYTDAVPEYRNNAYLSPIPVQPPPAPAPPPDSPEPPPPPTTSTSPSTPTPTNPSSAEPAGAVGGISSKTYLPSFDNTAMSQFALPPGQFPIEANNWRGNLGETSFGKSPPLGGLLLRDLNTVPWTRPNGTLVPRGMFPIFDYENRVTSDLTSVKTSTQGDPSVPGDPARFKTYLDGFLDLIGMRRPNTLTTAANNLNTTPADATQRGRLAINSDDVPGFKDFLVNDIQANPGNYPPGLTGADAAGKIVGNGLTTPQLTRMENARNQLGNLDYGDVKRIGSPDWLASVREGLPGAVGNSAVRGGVVGGVVGGLIQIGQIVIDPNNPHPDAWRQIGTGVGLGAAGGGIGSAGETYFNARFTQWMFNSLLEGGEVGGSTPFFGRIGGGGLGGGLGAAVVELGSMALDKDSHSAEDYAAKGARAAVVGGLSGALSAGVVGAFWGSEVPILGNIVGFGVGIFGYFLFNALVGDSVEGAVRSVNSHGHLP